MSSRRPPKDPAWCDQHQRRCCTKNTKRGKTRCHQTAISGLDACRLHCGKKTEKAQAEGQANLLRQRFRDVAADEYLDPGDVLAWAVTVAYIDVADYRMTLKDRTAVEDGKVPVTADELDRLMRMEADVARMSKLATDAGVEDRRLRIAERVAEQLVAVLRGVVTELGHNPADPKVAAVVHRHLQLVPRERSA